MAPARSTLIRRLAAILAAVVTALLLPQAPAGGIAAVLPSAPENAAASPVLSAVTVQATRASGEVVLLTRAYRMGSTGRWAPYAGAYAQLQYRTPGAGHWINLTLQRPDARGMATKVDASGASREYRAILRATSTIAAATSPTTTPRWCGIPSGLRGQDLTRVPTTAKVVALTFDAGANADAVDSILATLRAKGVPATFFLTGSFATAFPDQTRRIMSQYPTGNHTSTHPDLTRLSRAAALADIRRGAAQIRAVTGQDPHPWFRFPFGAVNSSVIGLVNDECYVPFRWTVDSLGWKGTSGGMTAAKVRERVLGALTPGEIVLFHVGSHPTDRSMLDAAALPGIIDAMRARGYGFVTLESVVADW